MVFVVPRHKTSCSRLATLFRERVPTDDRDENTSDERYLEISQKSLFAFGSRNARVGVMRVPVNGVFV